ncbi:transposase-like protein [Rhizobium sp. BK609]|nr:transposase-like protein [Rhizobium sp. BK098]MBB3618671.1 transposase-like protein [Rhizobium sp. BK609]MBB3684367.1 transposase-like protein [Rhizobium sp. BK612]
MDETYIKVRGEWMYLYRAIDSVGDTVEFLFSESRDLPAAKRFLRRALDRHGRPDCIVIDGSLTNHQAVISSDAEDRLRNRSRRSLNPIRIRRSKYLNNRIEQDHRRIKCRIRSVLGFKSTASAEVILRYRDGPYDAQTVGEVRRQSTPVNRRAIRTYCRLSPSAWLNIRDLDTVLRQNLRA